MRNKLLIALAALAILVALVYGFRHPLIALVTEDMFVESDEDAFSAGPEVGEILPLIRADYQGEEIRDLSRFSGEKGLVLMLNRSLDWCWFCQKQAVELNEHSAHFTEQGLGLVMLVYDEPADRDAFVREHGIQYPVLSDIDVESVRALNVLNTEYREGDGAYGVPYPGTIVVTPSGQIVGKLFVEEYSRRVSSESVLRHSLDWLSGVHGSAPDTEAPGDGDDGSATVTVTEPAGEADAAAGDGTDDAAPGADGATSPVAPEASQPGGAEGQPAR